MQKTKQITNVHQLKFSIFINHLTDTHDNEYWIDKIDKKEAKKLFDQFLILHQNAYEPFDNYDRKTREEHFENFKAFMIWHYRKNKIGYKKYD